LPVSGGCRAKRGTGSRYHGKLKRKPPVPTIRPVVSDEPTSETVGEMLAAISTRIVQLLRENYGRGPSRAKSYAIDDCIVCVLRNGFTAHERTIVEGGDPGRVIEMRQDFQRLMERQYRETIETITGRRVVAFLSQAHLEPDITLEIFFLDRPMNGSAALHIDLPELERQAAEEST
jgi:uncharacterized protein YbcI